MWDNIIVILEVLIRQFIRLMMPARRTQEILMLRKALQVLKRGAKRPILKSWDRLFFVSLLRRNEHVVGNIVTISPNTVLAWHRKLGTENLPHEDGRIARSLLGGLIGSYSMAV